MIIVDGRVFTEAGDFHTSMCIVYTHVCMYISFHKAMLQQFRGIPIDGTTNTIRP